MSEEKKEPIKKITLTDGSVVDIKTNISLGAMKRAQAEGLFSKNYLQEMILADKDPSKANFEDMENAPYIAYRFANPGGLSRDEFNNLLPNDLELFGQIYAQIVSGGTNNAEMAKAFKKATKK
ncbi:hypothetical protein [Pisciglobus halotolerans]|uniref:Uncharacterized protein n=1 Tax=Pisciglobus halotolerans TaxID=745365 RepID=A0A1I3C217_9LACT|nr:hypothetical protein [Pisciglobus halotolerans]SFH68605.1 hypothetical protein SAMN04489868_11234 [Pisciglobus halotolerans]